MAAAASESTPPDQVLTAFKAVQTLHTSLSEEDRIRLNYMTMSLATDFEKEIIQSLDRASMAYSAERFDNLRGNIASRLFSMGPRVGHKRLRDIETDDEVSALSLKVKSQVHVRMSLSSLYRLSTGTQDQTKITGGVCSRGLGLQPEIDSPAVVENSQRPRCESEQKRWQR